MSIVASILFFVYFIGICWALNTNDSSLTEERPDVVDINAKSMKLEIFDKILDPANYSVALRPLGYNGSGPVEVWVGMRIRSIENLDDKNMEYTIQMNLRQYWIDSRLNYKHLNDEVKYLQLENPGRVWQPDLMFSNEKTGSRHELMLENSYARIRPSGLVETSSRITSLLACQMDLHYYPMDKQSCPVQVGSFGWTEEDLILIWRKTGLAVELMPGIKMPQFRLISYVNESCATTETISGSYSCIVLRLIFERQFGYYLIQIYIPCIMLVVVSWVSFWLEPTAAEARISLCVTTILTVVTQAYGINQSVPPASYVKAIDVWTFMVQFMVFASILQFSYVNYVARFEWKRILKTLELDLNEGMEDQRENLKLRGERKAKLVDNVSKIVFPIVFGIFNVFYWFNYLISREEDLSRYQQYN